MELTMKTLSEYLSKYIYIEIYKGSNACDDLIESGKLGDLKSAGKFETEHWATLPIEPEGIIMDDGMLVVILS